MACDRLLKLPRLRSRLRRVWSRIRRLIGRTNRVYLAGPISQSTDSECNDWRSQAMKAFPAHFDPMVRDFRGLEHLPNAPALIVEGDKADIDKCEVMLVRYFKPSVGTAMEVLYAWERGKKVVVWADEGTFISPWMVYHSHAIVRSLETAVAVIASW